MSLKVYFTILSQICLLENFINESISRFQHDFMITEYSPHLERFLIDNNELNSPKTKFYSINCELINRKQHCQNESTSIPKSTN